jgi:hypothetical protein
MIEQREDGTMVLEYYVNGTRSQEVLFPGAEMSIIREAFAHQRRVAESYAERKAQLAELEEQKRHRRVWTHAAYARGQGVEFANRVIGPLVKKTPKMPVGIEATEDLI